MVESKECVLPEIIILAIRFLFSRQNMLTHA
jgi:hypothetical protein